MLSNVFLIKLVTGGVNVITVNQIFQELLKIKVTAARVKTNYALISSLKTF